MGDWETRPVGKRRAELFVHPMGGIVLYPLYHLSARFYQCSISHLVLSSNSLIPFKESRTKPTHGSVLRARVYSVVFILKILPCELRKDSFLSGNKFTSSDIFTLPKFHSKI